MLGPEFPTAACQPGGPSLSSPDRKHSSNGGHGTQRGGGGGQSPSAAGGRHGCFPRGLPGGLVASGLTSESESDELELEELEESLELSEAIPVDS